MKLDSQQTFDDIWPGEVLPSNGPYAHGDRVFVWIDDKAKYKAVGRGARARVMSQNGAIVKTDKAVLRASTGSAAAGGWTLGKEGGSGTSATAGKLLAE